MRYIKLFIFSIIILIVWPLFYSCKSHGVDQIEKLTVGTYIVDLSLSDSTFTEVEKGYYKGITLTFNENGDFTFSRAVPITEGATGKWMIEGIDIEKHVVLKYKNGFIQDISYCSRPDCTIDVQIPVYVESMPTGAKIVSFRKIK